MKTCHTTYLQHIKGNLTVNMNGSLRSRLYVLNGHLRLLTHLVELIIAIFWCNLFQTKIVVISFILHALK